MHSRMQPRATQHTTYHEASAQPLERGLRTAVCARATVHTPSHGTSQRVRGLTGDVLAAAAAALGAAGAAQVDKVDDQKQEGQHEERQLREGQPVRAHTRAGAHTDPEGGGGTHAHGVVGVRVVNVLRKGALDRRAAQAARDAITPLK